MNDDAPDDRVLAIMTKAPRAGHVKTRLAAEYGTTEIVALYRALVEDTIDLARSLRLRSVAVCPAGDEADVRRWLPADVVVLAQRGSGLAAGLASTFEQLCTASCRPVVAFNGDSPHLSPEVLAAAYAALRNHDLVVGPCDDGGYYLVGCTRSHAGLFDADVMGTATALEVLLARADRLGLAAARTTTHYDVDVPDDVVRLARDLSTNPQRAPRTAAILAVWGVANRRARS